MNKNRMLVVIALGFMMTGCAIPVQPVYYGEAVRNPSVSVDIDPLRNRVDMTMDYPTAATFVKPHSIGNDFGYRLASKIESSVPVSIRLLAFSMTVDADMDNSFNVDCNPVYTINEKGYSAHYKYVYQMDGLFMKAENFAKNLIEPCFDYLASDIQKEINEL